MIELLVVVAIIALLVSILLPSLGRAKEITKQAACMANMKAVGMQLYLYGDEHGGRPPKHDVMWDPISEDNYTKGFWSGILTEGGFISSSATSCNNPRGYTGGSGKPMVHSKDTMDDNVDPIPATVADASTGKGFYGTNAGDKHVDGYDYMMSLTWLGKYMKPFVDSASDGKWAVVAGTTKVPANVPGGTTDPRIGNEKVSSMTVMLMEWNWRREAGTNQARLLAPVGEFGPASMIGVVGKDDWPLPAGNGFRHTRHVGGTFGANNMVFVDNHAEAIPAAFDKDYWWAAMIPNNGHPNVRYPTIGFRYPFPNQSNHNVTFSWNTID